MSRILSRRNYSRARLSPCLIALYLVSPASAQLLNLACGRTKFAEPSGTVLSAGYAQGAYPSNVNCEYAIEMRAQEQVTFTFTELDLEDAGGGECYDYIKIISPSGDSSGNICGTSREPYTVTAELAGEVLIELITDESENRRGFKIDYLKGLPDPCQPNPCQHGATCTSVLGNARCICSAGWMGETCEEDVNECETSPPVCDEATQVCVNTPGSYARARSMVVVNHNLIVVVRLTFLYTINGF